MKATFYLTLFLTVVVSAFAQSDYLAELSKNDEFAKRLGIAKLSDSERAEWNKLLTAVYQAGANSIKNASSNQVPAIGSNSRAGSDQKAASGSVWISRADIDGDEIVKLRNGAVFQVSFGFLGIGLGRDAALIKEGSHWSLWIAGKREFRGELLKPPIGGLALSFRRSNISSVSSDGSVVKLSDGSIYEIDSIGRIDTMLWLPASELFVIDGTRLLNPDSTSGGVIQATLLK